MTKSLYIKHNFTCKLQVIQYQKKKKAKYSKQFMEEEMPTNI